MQECTQKRKPVYDNNTQRCCFCCCWNVFVRNTITLLMMILSPKFQVGQGVNCFTYTQRDLTTIVFSRQAPPPSSINSRKKCQRVGNGPRLITQEHILDMHWLAINQNTLVTEKEGDDLKKKYKRSGDEKWNGSSLVTGQRCVDEKLFPRRLVTTRQFIYQLASK
jgi:hypothetical protein